MNARKAGESDRELGRSLARQRKAAGLSQAQMGDALSISTQQYGKYERGENRLSVTAHEKILALLSGHSLGGFGETRQQAYVAPGARAVLQGDIDRMKALLDEMQATLAVWQRHFDRL